MPINNLSLFSLLGDECVTVANIHHHRFHPVIACNLFIQLPHSHHRGSINLNTEIIYTVLTEVTLHIISYICPGQVSIPKLELFYQLSR